MGLLDDVVAAAVLRGPTCSLAMFRATMAPEDAADLDTALADERYASSAIHRVLRARGYERGIETIKRHRRRICACP